MIPFCLKIVRFGVSLVSFDLVSDIGKKKKKSFFIKTRLKIISYRPKITQGDGGGDGGGGGGGVCACVCV